MMRRAVMIWMVLLIAAIANGAFRSVVLIPAYGDQTGHQISVLLLCGMIAILARRSIAWMSPPTVHAAYAIGGLWLILTVGFEFLAGHYVFGTPWPRLLADYDVAGGRIWPLVLLVTFAAPAWAMRAHSASRKPARSAKPSLRHV